MEHNYNNDNDFIEKINNFINITNNYLNISDISITDTNMIPLVDIYKNVESNIDIYTNDNPSMNKIKDCFWKNKDKNYFKNNKFNISLHIRRPNSHDNRIDGTNTCDYYYLNIINHIREKYKNDKDILFHIYSQGNIKNFECYINYDVILHIDEELTSTFTGLVASDILVTSKSSFSYIAAFLTDGEVYYLPFWHPPKKNWIVL